MKKIVSTITFSFPNSVNCRLHLSMDRFLEPFMYQTNVAPHWMTVIKSNDETKHFACLSVAAHGMIDSE